MFLFIHSSLFLQISIAQGIQNSNIDLTDTRDGQIYKTITFNNNLGMGVRKSQTWLAENLRYEVKGGSWYYDNNEKENKKYGRLYTWEAAKTACPEDWRLPSDLDWQILMHQLEKGGRALNAEALYQTLLEGGDSGFAALLGGKRTPDTQYFDLNKNGSYWSSTNRDQVYAWNYYLNNEEGKVVRYEHTKTHALSCRCIKD